MVSSVLLVLIDLCRIFLTCRLRAGDSSVHSSWSVLPSLIVTLVEKSIDSKILRIYNYMCTYAGYILTLDFDALPANTLIVCYPRLTLRPREVFGPRLISHDDERERGYHVNCADELWRTTVAERQRPRRRLPVTGYL